MQHFLGSARELPWPEAKVLDLNLSGPPLQDVPALANKCLVERSNEHLDPRLSDHRDGENM